jgi:hypothetical protein
MMVSEREPAAEDDAFPVPAVADDDEAITLSQKLASPKRLMH